MLVTADGATRTFASTEQPITRVLGLRSGVMCFDAGGVYLFEAAGDDGRVVGRVPLGEGPWTELAVAPRGDTFAAATVSGELAVWGTGRKLVHDELPESITGLAFLSADRLAVALASGVLATFAIEKRRLVRGSDLAIGPLARGPLAVLRDRLAVACATDVGAYTIAPASLAPLTRLPLADVRCLTWAPDGTLAAATRTETCLFPADSIVSTVGPPAPGR